MQEDDFNNDNLLLYMNGALWYNGEPQYLVKLVKQYGVRTVFIYNYSRSDYKQFKVVRRDWHTVDITPRKMLAGDSLIVKNHNKNVQKETRNIELPHLYSVPVVGGISTITDKEGDGFYERIKTRSTNGRSEAWSPNGVFISLDDITWDTDGFIYDAKSVTSEVVRADAANLRNLNPQSGGFYF